MSSVTDTAAQGANNGNGKKHILINAFDMSTVGHLSPGQWKVCSATSSDTTECSLKMKNRILQTDQRLSAD